MIRLGDERISRRRWPIYIVLSFFLHASFIGALVLVPEQSIKRFTSAMDFSVTKDEKKQEPPEKIEKPPEEEETEEESPPAVKKKIKKNAKKEPEVNEEKEEPPPPPEVKKFQMSESSFTGDGTWGIKADIGENRIGSFSGTAKETKKTSQSSAAGAGVKEKPKPKQPKKIVIKEKPKVIDEITIPYPTEARRLEIEGDVKLEVSINEKGTVTNVKILKDPGGGLGMAAAKALKKFRFSPARTQYGKAVPYTIKYIYSFVLD